MSMVVNPFAAQGVGACDPYFANVVLLCPCQGTNGDTTTPNLIVGAPTPLSRGGSATLSTTQAKFGGTSIHIGSSTEFFANNASSALWAFGNDAFTIEFWAYITSLVLSNPFDMRPNASGAYGTFAVLSAAGAANYGTNNTSRITTATGVVIANQWQFWSYSKQAGSGGTGQLAIDGVVGGSWSDTTTYANASVWIGSASSFPLDSLGYFGPLRITKGIARYSGNFSPPTTMFPTQGCGTDPYISSVSFLWNGAGSNGGTSVINLVATNPTALAALGTATLSTTQTKFSAPVSAAMNGTTNDWLGSVTGTPDQNFGTAPFTMECWVYFTSIAATNFFDMRVANGFHPLIFLNANGSLGYYVNAITRITTASSLIAANTWYFVAYSKQNGSATGELSINGTVQASWTDTMTYVNSAVGFGDNISSAAPSGYMGPVRITKGVARYSGNFIPLTDLFPTS